MDGEDSVTPVWPLMVCESRGLEIDPSLSGTQGPRPVIGGGNPKMDGRPEFWDMYNQVFIAHSLWDDDWQPVLIADDDYANLSFFSMEELGDWKEEAQVVALGAYRPILEDGPDISRSEESSDHGEEIEDGHTPDCP
jgi:hypothetical protein